MRAALVALGIRLGWIGVDNMGEAALETVMEHLRDEDRGVLLIFDNATDVDAVKSYLAAPRSSADVELPCLARRRGTS